MRSPLARKVLVALAVVGALSATMLAGAEAVSTTNSSTPAAAASPSSLFPGLEGGPAGTGPACDGPSTVCRGRLLFGLATPDSKTQGTTFTGLETSLGQHADFAESYQDFTEPMYVSALDATLAHSRTPVVTWEPYRSTSYKTDAFPLAQIAAGKFDAYLKKSAAQAKQVHGDFVIRFGHEMNGFWYPWGQPKALNPQSVADPKNTPAAYVAAYRHVVNVFRAAGATNVNWMWSPNLVDANPGISLASLYPGDSYVDVIGLSGYESDATMTFDSRFTDTFADLAEVAPTKPIVIAETGVAAGDSRPTQITALVRGLLGVPNVVGLIYFSDPDVNVDYELPGDTASLNAFKTVLAEQQVGQPYGALNALVDSPQITGDPLVGSTLHATYAWRGTVSASTSRWESCPTAVFDSSTCAQVGYGDTYTAALADRGDYLLNVLDADSASAITQGVAAPIGPIKVDPPAVPVDGIDLLASAQDIRFGTAAPGVTDWVVTLDGGTPVYLPSSTATYYFSNLAPGSSHTVVVGSCDCPQKGPTTTYTFGVVTKPPAATIAVTGTTAAATLPTTSTGQTGWAVSVDGGSPVLLDTTATSYEATALSSGSHTLALARVAGDGRTTTAVTSFTVS